MSEMGGGVGTCEEFGARSVPGASVGLQITSRCVKTGLHFNLNSGVDVGSLKTEQRGDSLVAPACALSSYLTYTSTFVILSFQNTLSLKHRTRCVHTPSSSASASHF